MEEAQTRPMKRVQDSETTFTEIVIPSHLNGKNRLFGGQLMNWMDVVASVAARRHAGGNVTTARIEEVEFLVPARQNDTVFVTGHVCYVGRSSMTVNVCVFIEALDGTRTLANRARFILVGLDENERPAPVPGLILETEEQRREWAEAEEAALRLKKAKQ